MSARTRRWPCTQNSCRADERVVREVLELEVGIERPGVVAPAARLRGLARAARARARREPPDLLGERISWTGSASGSIATRPVAVRQPVGRHARRPVDRPHARAGIRRDGGRVEGRVLDLVAHPDHDLLAHRLDVHQRAAVGQPELAVSARRATRKRKSRNWCGAPTSSCMPLKIVADVVAREAERALHALRVDRARAHPLLDRDRRASPRAPCRMSTCGMPARSWRCAGEHVLAARG